MQKLFHNCFGRVRGAKINMFLAVSPDIHLKNMKSTLQNMLPFFLLKFALTTSDIQILLPVIYHQSWSLWMSECSKHTLLNCFLYRRHVVYCLSYLQNPSPVFVPSFFSDTSLLSNSLGLNSGLSGNLAAQPAQRKLMKSQVTSAQKQ